MDIIKAIHSDKIFKPLFRDLESWKSWVVCLKAIFGLPMDRKERRIYRKFTGRTDRPSKQFSEAFLIVGRRGGKSLISALISVFLATFREWNLGLEKGYIMCIGVDKKQAAVVLDYVRQILQLPIFKNMIVAERAEEIELSNRMVIAVHTCSYRSLRGYQTCAVVLDEIGFYLAEGSNPAKEILTALRPSLGNVEGSLLLGISTPYSRRGVLWEAFRDKYGKNDPQYLVWKAGTQDMNPTYSSSVIQRALNDDYTAARAEYFGEFRADLETFLSSELIDAAVVLNRYELPPLSDTTYYCFVDPSGGRGDSMTLSICHREESGQIIQDHLAIKCPPFDPGVCVIEFSKVLRDYGISMIEGDRYAGEWVSSAFEKEGIFYQPAALSKSDVYLEALPLFMQGRIALLDNKQQTNELKQLERRTRTSGKDSVDHPRGLHDDCANALCGSLNMVARTEALRTPPPSRGIIEDVEDEKGRMDRESTRWLLGLPQKKKKQNPDEIDMEEIEAQLQEWQEEIETELKQKDTAKDVVFKRGW